MSQIHTFFRKTFKLPYNLTVVSDDGSGQPIIFLHGIASNSNTWHYVLPLIEDLPVRAITVDVLGFGASPKPDWIDYTIDDHVKSVAYTIARLRLKRKPIIVGHSMGSLIATEYAAKYPKKVSRLILCSIPLYTDEDIQEQLPVYSKYGRKLNDAYFAIYQKIIESKDIALRGAKQLESRNKIGDFHLDNQNWIPFERSLKNSIIKQRSIELLEQLSLPIDIVYGRRDLLLLSKYFTALAKINKHISLTTVQAAHAITPPYAKVLAKVIENCVDTSK